MNEFDLIKKFFRNNTLSRSDVVLGIGDDAALLQVPAQQLLVSSIDTLVEGVHFPPETTPADIGYKALVVNLSDLAAMGAAPAWMMLALTLPEPDEKWLEAFTAGLFELANQFGVQLIGGDTTRGPLTITIQVSGFVPPDQVLYRHGAKVGDKIYVSGTLGDAGLGLQIALGQSDLPDHARQFLLQRLNRPLPRIALGILLRELASSAIDISDGFLADLNHVIASSGVGATVMATQLPLSSTLRSYLSLEKAQALALTAGDDYELCFTVAPSNEKKLLTKLKAHQVKCYCVGEIETMPGLRISEFSGQLKKYGFQHF